MDPKDDNVTALSELQKMLEAFKRDASDYFSMGKFKARKALANGYTVTVTITKSSCQK